MWLLKRLEAAIFLRGFAAHTVGTGKLRYFFLFARKVERAHTPMEMCLNPVPALRVPTDRGAGKILFILAPPRSFTTIVSHMLGQHPEMYGLPETHLPCAQTMSEWFYHAQTTWIVDVTDIASQHPSLGSQLNMEHGLFRVVAQVYAGEQTDPAIRWASEWLKQKSEFTTGAILELVAEKLRPRMLVEKSPSTVYRLEFLQQTFRRFPQARFIHLVRHPCGHGESVMKYLKAIQRLKPIPRSHWLFRLASFPAGSENLNNPERPQALDPQRGWYVLNSNIYEFLKSVPESQKKRIIGEELLSKPESGLRDIAAWLGLRTDSAAIEEMKHPERSPYACFGPPSARYGNDHFFLKRPRFHPNGTKSHRLEGPVSWRENGQGLLSEVKQLAREFGYQ